MSHSNDMAILAITKNHTVGVDIECIKPINDTISIVQQYFSSKEKAEFLTVPAEQKLEAFYAIWTRKEAFIKAIGDGLSYPLDIFDVSFFPRDPIKILAISNSTIEASKWSLNGFTFNHANNSYITAIITKSVPKKIICFYYPRDLFL
jgi:4'-phosphopantetheinyl transferase